MQTQIENGPAYGVASVALNGGERMRAEGGAMMAMSSDLGIETGTQGGMMKALRRSVLGGESMFINTFTAPAQGGWIRLAQQLPGDIRVRELAGETVMLQSGAFLGGGEGVDVDTKWGGAKSFFGTKSLFLLRCSGQGPLIVSAFGAITDFRLEPGQGITVDPGHVVAFEESVQFSVRRIGGWKSTILSGQGIVVDLTGPGEVWLQTRSIEALEEWVLSVVPTQSDSSG